MKQCGQTTKQAQHGALNDMVHKFPFETQYYHETSHPQPENKISPNACQACSKPYYIHYCMFATLTFL
jgi:hypothetical protein